MLEAFYTDVSGNVGPGRWFSAARYLPWIGRPFDRLYQRQIPSTVSERATAFSGSTLADTLLQEVFGASRNYRYTGRQMLRHGFGNANLVYSFLGWGRTLLEEAKARGIPIVTDFYVRPSISQICREEFQAFPGWESESENSLYVNRIGGEHDPCLVSDYLVVADDAVADEVSSLHGFPRIGLPLCPWESRNRFLRCRIDRWRDACSLLAHAFYGKGFITSRWRQNHWSRMDIATNSGLPAM